MYNIQDSAKKNWSPTKSIPSVFPTSRHSPATVAVTQKIKFNPTLSSPRCHLHPGFHPIPPLSLTHLTSISSSYHSAIQLISVTSIPISSTAYAPKHQYRMHHVISDPSQKRTKVGHGQSSQTLPTHSFVVHNDQKAIPIAARPVFNFEGPDVVPLVNSNIATPMAGSAPSPTPSVLSQPNSPSFTARVSSPGYSPQPNPLAYNALTPQAYLASDKAVQAGYRYGVT